MLLHRPSFPVFCERCWNSSQSTSKLLHLLSLPLAHSRSGISVFPENTQLYSFSSRHQKVTYSRKACQTTKNPKEASGRVTTCRAAETPQQQQGRGQGGGQGGGHGKFCSAVIKCSSSISCT